MASSNDRPPVAARVRRALGRLRRSVLRRATGFIALKGRVAQQRLKARFVRGLWLRTGDYAARAGSAAMAAAAAVEAGGETRIAGPTFVPAPPVKIVGGPLYAAYPDRTVSLLVKPWVIGHDGAVVGRDRRLLWDLSYEWPGRPHLHTTYALATPAAPRVPGVLATIAAMGADRNYFHFLLNSVARLAYLQRAGGLAAPDRFLVSGRITPFVAESLALFGIPRDRLIGTVELPAGRPDFLLAPSLVESPFVVPAHVCEFLHQAVLSAIPPHPAVRRRLFIDRSDARTRRIANLTALRPMLDEHGIEVVRLSGLSLAAQAALFNQAELIIANHGAALSNLVFCAPGARVLQVLAPGMMESEYRTISQHRSLRHDYLVGAFATPADASLARKDRDLVIGPDALRTVLETEGWTVRPHLVPA